MEKADNTLWILTPLDSAQASCIVGGGSQWDQDIAEGIGKGVGYAAKKMWRLFKFLSKNLYEIQSQTQVIHK
jgi:hypothetical protein